jgi:hypothetical protein
MSSPKSRASSSAHFREEAPSWKVLIGSFQNLGVKCACPNDIDLLRDFSPKSLNYIFDSILMYHQLGVGLRPFHFSVIPCTSCQIWDYQRHVAVARTAKIPGSVANATSCPHSKNEFMSLSECKNVINCLLVTYTYSLYLIILNEHNL